ncbi:MAG: flagellar biosynthesis protein FlhF, partial [Synergistaceae bacterium]|nr:flagellar biosynthesis protein FlhF [Synergistaceae bacterium]
MRVIDQITFEAKDDAEALRLAAERLGKDAVILSTRMVKEGGIFGVFKRPVLRVTAGVLEEDRRETKPKSKPKDPRMDEDARRENLIAFQKLMELKERSTGAAPAPSAIPTGGEGYRAPGVAEVGSPDGDRLQISPAGLRSAYGIPTAPKSLAPQPQRPTQPTVDEGLSEEDARTLKDEVGALNQKLDSLLDRIAAVEGRSASPSEGPAVPFQAGLPAQDARVVKSSADRKIEDSLRASEVDEKYIRKLLADYGVSDRRATFTDWLASQIPCAGDGGGDAAGGRKVMLLGPTGVGKTTTIAKLAAIQALWEHRNVLLLTSDTYRIAAVDQLKTYAKILGVPVEVVFEAGSLPQLLDAHEDADIILLDTAGRAQRDRKTQEVFEALYEGFAPDAVHLVLAANMKYRDMVDVVEHMPDIPVSHLIFTKLDETVSYGAIFNIQQMMGRPVSFLTAGQNVPRDIETASGGRIAEFLMMAEEERRRP